MPNPQIEKRPEIVFVKFSGASKGKDATLFTKNDHKKTGATVKSDRAKERQSIADAIYQTGSSEDSGIAMSASFTRKDVCSLFNVTEGRLKYWDKTGFIVPSTFSGKRRCYSFSDLISVKSAIELLENGVSLQKTRLLIEQLARLLPAASTPLGKLRITGDSRKVTVLEEGREFEVDSGQLVFDFTVQNIEESVISSLPDHADKVKSRTAYQWYLEASRLDENEETFDDAEYAYHQSILLDSEFANAYTNLGNLRYRRGASQDARALYQKALEIEKALPEALYNLGFIEFEEGYLTAARHLFEQAVELDSTFADGFFNLAMTLFKLNEPHLAANYWNRYLVIEPDGVWADVARRHLAEM